MIELLGQGVIILGNNGRFEYTNPTYAHMIARSPQELIGLSPLDVTHPDDQEIVRQARQQNLSGEQTSYEVRLVRPNGALVYTHITAIPRWQGETVVNTYAIVTDLTNLKRSEAEILETQDQLVGIFTSVMDAIITIDESQHIVFFNNSAEEMFGCPSAAAIGQRIDRYIPERFRAVHEQHIKNFGLTGVTSRKMGHLNTLWALRDDGTEFPIEASISQAKMGGQVFYTVILRDITERKQAEEALRESEAHYRSTLDNMLEGCQIIEFDWRYLYINQAGIIQAKRSKETLLGYTMMEAYPGIEHTTMFEALKRCMDERLVTHMENEFMFPDGSKGWFELRIQPVSEGIFILSRDISKRKRAEASLRENEARYRSVVEDMPGFLCRFHPDGTIEYVNATYAHTFGQQAEDMIGQSFLALIPEETRVTVKAELDALTPQAPIITHEYPVMITRGDVRWQRWTNRLLTDEAGQVIAYQSFGLDITDYKHAEEALRQSQTQLQHIIDTVPEGVLLLDTTGEIHLANPTANKFLTILAPEREYEYLTNLGKRPLTELLTSPPKGLWHEIADDDYAFETIARPIENSAHNSGWVLVLRDVTQERDIQRRIQQQERLVAVGHLAAGIAHDFNNIMAVIILYVQIILRTIELPPRTQKSLSTIESQAQRAVDLIQQILDFSRQSVLERHLLDLRPFMEELVKLFERTLPEHIQIKLTDTGETYLIHADPSRIQQVMMNLAVNAHDAMPGGGSLDIKLAHVQTKETKSLVIGDMPPGNWVQIEVADSGSGIPAEQLLQIFEPFFTTKEVGQGTGLGLAQVYGIVKQHEGFIDVVTKVDQGTTFILYFPVLNSGESAAIPLNTDSLKLGQGQTVLLVEDDYATRNVLLSSLLLMNYEVIEAKNGREAVDILETKGHDISLVLSDVVMPQMGGIALFHFIRQQNLKIPMVLLTGHPLSTEMENLQVLGLAGWLSKPPDLVNLSQFLAQVMAANYPR